MSVPLDKQTMDSTLEAVKTARPSRRLSSIQGTIKSIMRVSINESNNTAKVSSTVHSRENNNNSLYSNRGKKNDDEYSESSSYSSSSSEYGRYSIENRLVGLVQWSSNHTVDSGDNFVTFDDEKQDQDQKEDQKEQRGSQIISSRQIQHRQRPKRRSTVIGSAIQSLRRSIVGEDGTLIIHRKSSINQSTKRESNSALVSNTNVFKSLKSETDRVICTRRLIYFVLSVTAIGLGMVAYYSRTRYERDEFHKHVR
jgi:hypothetical protein